MTRAQARIGPASIVKSAAQSTDLHSLLPLSKLVHEHFARYEHRQGQQ